MKRGGRTIEDPATCAVHGCWRVIERKWRICLRCWHRLPKAIRGCLANLREWSATAPPKHPQDSTKADTATHLYGVVWREALRFLNTGERERGRTLPWRVGPGSSFERGPFHRHHEQAAHG